VKKLDSLRAWLEACCPSLKRDPELLLAYIEGGGVTASGIETPGETAGVAVLSHRYAYKATLLIDEFPGQLDELMIPILAWVARHQPELLGSAAGQKPAIVFDADRLRNDSFKIAIELALTEFVRVVRRPDGGFDLQHLDEPDFTEGPSQKPREVYLDGELVATFPGNS
jgi:hypothetical protein